MSHKPEEEIMVQGVNKVILIGNLGADPELRYTPNGTAVADFRIATTERWKDKEGNSQDRTEWHRIVVWCKLAEVAGEYSKRAVRFMERADCGLVAGRIKTV